MANSLRIAAIGDIHIRTTVPTGIVKELIGVENHADILVVTGDITNGGRIQEAELAAEFFERIPIPILTVLGNHDRRTMRRKHFVTLLSDAGVQVLDGDTYVHQSLGTVGFAGVGGSGGGFWPEEATNKPRNRAFQALAVRARREAARLDDALTSLETPTKVAILHFAPTVTTLEGEPPAKFPLLGNSTLGKVVDEHNVDLVLHGHAHIGSHEGMTPGGIPVRNVAVGVTGGVTYIELPARIVPVSEADSPVRAHIGS